MPRLRSIATTAFLLSLAACSSVPDFRPSRPVEEASSLQDAVSLCAAYQITGEKTAAGTAAAARTVVLVPWIRCLENVFRKFPASREDEPLVMLFRCLGSRHDSAPTADAAIIDWPEFNAAMSTAFAHVIDPTLKYEEQDSRRLERQLPDYWIFLAESRRLDRPQTQAAATRSRREELRREIEGHPESPAGPHHAANLPLRPLPLTAEQRAYCKSYLAYQSLLYNVEELGEYKRVLEERTRDDVGNTNELAMRDRVDARFAALKKEAADSWRRLAEDLRTQQSKSKWFQNGYCVDQQSGHLMRKS